MSKAFSAIFLAALFVGELQGQFDSGQIAGYIHDASQAVVTGATVTVANQGNGEQRRTTTNTSGYYVFTNLPVGTYTVSAEQAGFKKTIQSGVVLDSAARLNIDLVLTVGAVSESIEVKAAGTQVQTETAQVGRVVDTKQIQDLTL